MLRAGISGVDINDGFNEYTGCERHQRFASRQAGGRMGEASRRITWRGCVLLLLRWLFIASAAWAFRASFLRGLADASFTLAGHDWWPGRFAYHYWSRLNELPLN